MSSVQTLLNELQTGLTTMQTKVSQLKTALSTTPAPTPTTSTTIHAWIYPGFPANNAPETYRNNKIDVLRAEYFRVVATTGNLQRLDEIAENLGDTQNGYSAENVQDLKKYSKEQFVTVASGYEGMKLLVHNAAKVTANVNTLVNFVVANDMTGIDIDYERYGAWSVEDYKAYKNYINKLGTALRAKGKKLALCAPNWTTGTPEKTPFKCGWNWADFEPLPVDYITVMMYDAHWDFGGGSSITPLNWLATWVSSLVKQLPVARLVFGIPSYGYKATRGEYDITVLTLEEIKKQNGYSLAARDAGSAEMVKIIGNTVYVSNDKTSLNAKRKVVEENGGKAVAVWHLGGNEWF